MKKSANYFFTEAKTGIVSNYSRGGALLYLQKFTAAIHKKDYPVIFYLPKEACSFIKDAGFYRFVLKEPSVYPLTLKIKSVKYVSHFFKYLYNALRLNPDRCLKTIHILFPFYLTDWITVGRLKKMGFKVILTIHEVFPHKAYLGGEKDMALLNKMYEKSDLLFVHNKSLGDEIIDLFSIKADKIRVIPHGIFDLPESPIDVVLLKRKYNIPYHKKVLLFFGTIRDNKGLDILLKAFNELKDKYFLIIAGDVAESIETSTKYYEKVIKNSGLIGSLLWIRKYIQNDEIPDIFAITDAVVLPYKKSFHAQSGVLHLSIGYEKPCIVSDVGAIGVTVKEYDLGLVVQAEDPSDLKRGVVNLFEKIDKKYFFNFRKCKEDNNWDKIADKAISIYNEFL